MRTTHDLLINQALQSSVTDQEIRGHGEVGDEEIMVADMRTQLTPADDIDRKLQASLCRAGSILFHAPLRSTEFQQKNVN